MKNLKILAMSIFLVNCGGGSFSAKSNEIAGTPSIGNAGVSQIDETGGKSGVENSSVGGNSSNAGNSSIGGMNNIAGSNSNGGINSIAGMSNNAGSSNIGTAGNATCIPITCDDFSLKQINKTGMTCGTIDDGCGHMIDCVANKSEGNAICPKFYKCGGGGDFIYSDNAPGGPGNLAPIKDINNICSGGCSMSSLYWVRECSMTAIINNMTNTRPDSLYCNNNLPSYTANDLPIGVDCVKTAVNVNNPTGQIWCCSSIN